MRQKGLRAIDHAPKINVHQPIEIINTQFVHRGAHGDPGIVEHEIRTAIGFFNMGGQFVYAVSISRIQNMRVYRTASTFDELGCFIEHVFANVCDNSLGTIAGQRERAGTPDATCRACNNADLLIIKFHKVFPQLGRLIARQCCPAAPLSQIRA